MKLSVLLIWILSAAVSVGDGRAEDTKSESKAVAEKQVEVDKKLRIALRMSGEDKILQPDPMVIVRLENIGEPGSPAIRIGREDVTFFLAPKKDDLDRVWQGCGDFPKSAAKPGSSEIVLQPKDSVEVVWTTEVPGCPCLKDGKSVLPTKPCQLVASWFTSGFKRLFQRHYGKSVVGVTVPFSVDGKDEVRMGSVSMEVNFVMIGLQVIFWAGLGGVCGYLLSVFGGGKKIDNQWLDISLSVVGAFLVSAILTLVVSEIEIKGVPVKLAADSLTSTIVTGFVFYFAGEPVKKWLLSFKGSSPRNEGDGGGRG